MAKVIILCGRISSGKTTYANRLREDGGAVVLSVDDLMLTLFDHCLGMRHDTVAEKITHYFTLVAKQIIGTGTDVVLDYGYWTKAERDSVKRLFAALEVEWELHYVNIAREERLKRLALRNESLRDSVKREYVIEGELFDRLDAVFEEPQQEEFDCCIS